MWRVALKLHRPFDGNRANTKLLEALRARRYDMLWIDKGNTLRPRTLARARSMQPRMSLVAYSPDNMALRHCNSVNYLRSIALYDLHVTTKSRNVRELAALGAREVVFVDNAYDRRTHRPWQLDDEERVRLGADVGFIGTFEGDRARCMLRLAREGLRVRVWGIRWRRFLRSHPNLIVEYKPLLGDDYAKGICATRINLGFLRRRNRDVQTTRSVEIPACGGFMLAERSEEHLRLFREGVEAEYFGSFEELLGKCRYYLEHEDERARIARAGRQRCLDDGYSNEDRLRRVLDHVAAMRSRAQPR